MEEIQDGPDPQIEAIKASLASLHNYKDELAGRERDVDRQILAARERLIALICKHKIGDRWTDRRGKTFEITQIRPSSRAERQSDHRYDVFGHEVLKSGHLHKRESKLWDLGN